METGFLKSSIEAELELGDCCFMRQGAKGDGTEDECCGKPAVVVLFAPAEFDGLGACGQCYRRHQDLKRSIVLQIGNGVNV